MTFEQPHSEQPQSNLIDQKESHELKSGQIDRVEDEGVNSYDDLKTFLQEQSTQAQELLTKKADSLRQDLNAGDIDQALQEALNQITEVLDTALCELSITSVRMACSQLSDIAGFNLEIDKEGLDQFGLTKRETARDTKHGTGFENYREEFQEKPLGKKKKYKEKIPGALEITERNARMRQMDTSMSEVTTVMNKMKPFGTVEYKPFANASGPVLIAIPEIHNDPDVISSNFDLLLTIQDHIALLATEGEEGEITENDVNGRGTDTREENVTRIRTGNTNFSSEALENVAGGEIRTLGAENRKTLVYSLRKNLIAEKTGDAMSQNSELRKALLEFWEKAKKGEISKGDFIRDCTKILDQISEEILNTTADYRNQIWLNNIQEDMLENSEKLSSNNNIVVLVCGGLHQQDLLQQAEHYGFKGVVHFTPHSFTQPMDGKKLPSI